MIIKFLSPHLLGFYFILYLFSRNLAEVSLSDLIIPTIATWIGATVLLLCFRIWLGSNKALIITTVAIGLFFGYGYIKPSLFIGREVTSVAILFSIIIVALVLLGFILYKIKWNLDKIPLFLSLVTVILVLFPTVQIAKNYNHDIKNPLKVTTPDISLGDNPVNIYYILLDEFGRHDTLLKYWNYDNSEFVNFLKNRGFYIAEDSHSNYDWTIYSLQSSLNMGYIPDLGITKMAQLWEAMANNRVSLALQSIGYSYVMISNRPWTVFRKYAQVDSYSLIPFIATTPFIEFLVQATPLNPILLLTKYQARQLYYAFDHANQIVKTNEPTFAFIYIQCPHMPAIVDKNGNAQLFKKTSSHDAYLEQLIYVQKQTMKLISNIPLDRSIVVLQSDTGPNAVYIGKNDELLPQDEFQTERMKILNAYSFPDKDYSQLYQTISPVNSFRVIFNQYFNSNMQLFQDRQFANPKGTGLIFEEIAKQ